MRSLKVVLVMVAVSLLAFGCGKKSALEGKVVDGQGQPISGLKVIAKQVQPIKGYEQFETTTGSDGAFTFSKLFPTSEYVLKPWSDKWTTDVSVTVESGPEGETKLLKEPLMITVALNDQGSPVDPRTGEARFTVSAEGVIKDSRTALEWYVGPDSDTTWDQASSWVQGLSVSGGGWRLPTLEELKGLYQKGLGERNMAPAFKTTGWWVWSSQLRDSSSAWYFGFYNGGEHWSTRSNPYSEGRAFAVRSRK